MDILNALVSSKITVEQVLVWLTLDCTQNDPFENVIQTDVTKNEFILYFLNYLRAQSQSILLQAGTCEISQVQLKKTISSSQPRDRNDTISEKTDKIFTNKNANFPKLQNNAKSKTYDENKIANNTRNQCYLIEEKFADINICDKSIENGLTSTPIKTPEHNSHSVDCKSSLLSLANATPGVPYSSQNDTNTTNMSQDNSNFINQSPLYYSPISKLDIRRSVNFNQSKNSPNNSTFNNSFPDLSTSFHQSKNNTSTDEHIFNLSITSNNTPSSPISPLYTANTPQKYSEKINILTPKHKSAGKNNFKNKHSPIQNQQQNSANKNNNRSFCLGDFLTVDMSVASKKKNDKNNDVSANELLNKSQQKSKSKRRIKPTKLDISNNAENQNQQVFGIVNRPAIVNPQFAEAQSKDKSNETTAFEVERGLLKLERQRQPKPEIAESVQELSMCHSRLNPLTNNTTNVTPKIELVENVDILNILTRLYGFLLNHILVPNLTTELYFIVSLITAQYKSSNDQHEDEENKNMVQDPLEQLKENLGCRDIDDILTTENTKCTASKHQQSNKLHQNVELRKSREIIIEPQLSYFETAHNCIYFSTAVLADIERLLVILDRSTLKLLAENSLVSLFQPELQKYLDKLYKNKCQQSTHTKPYNETSVLQSSNVCFQMDTDNRENFPSGVAFTTFRKQRDLFYEILKIWEDNHLSKKWSFSVVLEKRINTMLSMHQDTVNYYHIARLFKSQLLMSSIEINKQTEPSLNDDSLSILKDVKHLNPDKLKQLKERLITPVTADDGPVQPPSFPGIQEFYRDFLLTFSNQKFYVILQDCFIQEIVELNDVKFERSDIDVKESAVDESTKQNFLFCISSLRLMAKFLGFLTSLPYRQSQVTSLDAINTQISLRSRTLPPLDLQEYLSDALKYGKLSLAIPWIVQYLAMLDSISFRLPYYLNVCEALYCIYREVRSSIEHQTTALLIALSIGWLFELPNFPKDLYNNWYLSYNNNKTKRTSGKINTVNKSELLLNDLMKKQSVKSNTTNQEYNLILDKMNIIDDRVLYICCPFLKVFKVLLTSGNANSNKYNSQNANRHITPVSSQLSQPSNATKTMLVQLQLEEAFFRGQPKSVKITVDFTSERIASSCVKYICRTLIPKVNDDSFDEYRKLIGNLHHEAKKLSMSKQMDKLAVMVITELRKKYKEVIPLMVQTKSKDAMKSLLAEDTLLPIIDMCIKIAQRLAMERIDAWIDSYIKHSMTPRSIYELYCSKKYGEYSNEQDDQDTSTTKKTVIHNPLAPCSTDVITELRNSLWELLEQHGKWTILTPEKTLINIENVKKSLNEREDTVDIARRVLYTMSVDYALHIIVLKKELMSSDVENSFIELWRECDHKENLFSNLLSSRNIKLLMQTLDKTVCSRYGKFIGRLLSENILGSDEFYDECVAVLRVEWPENALKSIAQCISETLSFLNCPNKRSEKVKQMIKCVTETYY